MLSTLSASTGRMLTYEPARWRAVTQVAHLSRWHSVCLESRLPRCDSRGFRGFRRTETRSALVRLGSKSGAPDSRIIVAPPL